VSIAVHLLPARTRTIAQQLILVLAAFPLASCADTEEFVERSVLLRDPVSQLRLPAAVELAHVGAERVATFEGPQSAFDGYILGTNADADAVLAYYARELERLGWTREATTRHATTELAAWWWCKERMTYRLAIEDQKKAFQPEFYQGQTFQTVLDATLMSRSRFHPCPYVPSPLPTRP